MSKKKETMTFVQKKIEVQAVQFDAGSILEMTKLLMEYKKYPNIKDSVSWTFSSDNSLEIRHAGEIWGVGPSDWIVLFPTGTIELLSENDFKARFKEEDSSDAQEAVEEIKNYVEFAIESLEDGQHERVLGYLKSLLHKLDN